MVTRREISTAPRQMKKFRTVKAVTAALSEIGGYIEKNLDTELPQYAPHRSRDERGWPHGIWIKDELLAWANETQLGAERHPDWY